ncbi:hypothetical protein [Synechococcus sp. ATX 2A4]|nr:hypothetical protein [Synechococcus sp. ATX 2A4]
MVVLQDLSTLAAKDSAVEAMGDAKLKLIAAERFIQVIRRVDR